jgi:endonuclease/exonuclease/phosphatase (EEP) superfamily protein YafD
MTIAYYILSVICIIASLLPFVRNQHWIFRVWEFGRIQLMIIQLTLIILGLLLIDNKNNTFWITIIINTALLINHAIILVPYTIIYRKKPSRKIDKDSTSISIISVNVYQFNNEYQKLITLIKEVQPDIILTMESNQDWDNALIQIEKDYPNFNKVPLENTYGIHFYTRLQVKSVKVNYFIADDLPSIEASLLTNDGISFTFFGVHPPPPSPTEEDTSKERDGELLAVGKRVKETKGPVIVVGDFNNVAWARSSILFRKTSELIDPRIGRGFISTFHANYRLLRFPIDLFFHSTDIFVEDFKTLRTIGSDHLPLFCSFFMNKDVDIQEEKVEYLNEEERQKVNEIIKNGIEEESDRPKIVKE